MRISDFTKLVSALILCVLVCCACSAPDSFLSSDSKPRAEKDNSVLNIAFAADSEPFSYPGENDEALGFDAALCMRMCEELELRPVFLIMPRDELLSAVRCGIADIAVSSLAADDDSRRLTDFTDSYITLSSSIVTNVNNTAVRSTYDLREAANIAVVYGSLSHSYAMEQGLSNISLFKNAGDAKDALLSGAADVLLSDSRTAYELVTENVGFAIRESGIASREYHIAVRDGSSDMLRNINEVLSGFKEDNTLLDLRLAYINGNSGLRAEYDARLTALQSKQNM